MTTESVRVQVNTLFAFDSTLREPANNISSYVQGIVQGWRSVLLRAHVRQKWLEEMLHTGYRLLHTGYRLLQAQKTMRISLSIKKSVDDSNFLLRRISK